eukprot:9173011-Pyramimonas_sp.AAC.1
MGTFWGGECTLVVIGAGGPVKPSHITPLDRPFYRRRVQMFGPFCRCPCRPTLATSVQSDPGYERH